MRTMHPVLKRGGLFWDEALLPRTCYAERFARIKAAIAAAGDDAWLVYGDVERYGHVAYFSNFLPRTRSALALVPRDGEPSLLVSVGQRDIPAAKTLTWIDDVRPFSNLPDRLIALIHDKGLAKGRFGLVGVEEAMPFGDWTPVAAALPEAQWQTRTGLMAGLRQGKDHWELAALRRSAGAVAAAFDAVPPIIHAGLTTRRLAAFVDRELRRRAAEDVRVLVATGGANGKSLRPASDVVVQDGDWVMLYVAAEVQRYWAAAARTFVLGGASRVLHPLAERVCSALSAMRAAAVPGAVLAQLVAIADDRLGDTALRASASAHGYAHGIGLDLEEAPLHIADDRPLPADASLVLQIIGRERDFAIALGETIVVAPNSGEALIEAPPPIECRPSL